MEGEMARLYRALRVPFDAASHHRAPAGSSPLIKHAPEAQILIEPTSPGPYVRLLLTSPGPSSLAFSGRS